MRKRLAIGALGGALACGVAFVSPLHAATETDPATVNITVSAMAKLTLTPGTIQFTPDNPNIEPDTPAAQNPVSVRVAARTTTPTAAVTLTVLASDDLRSGSDVIAIGQVRWTASGTGLVNGTMSKSSPVTVGQWSGPGLRTGSLNYFLANSWNYATGSYATTATYTLSAP
jgi:hypothetical protein